MIILVTGGTGFLGYHLKKEFDKTDHDVWYLSSRDKLKPRHISCNLIDGDVEKVINQICPDTILHGAALAAGIGGNQKNPARFLTDNLKMSINLYEATRKYSSKTKIYSLGSVCGYPKFCPIPFKEDDFWKDLPESTNLGYGHYKRTLLIMQNMYRLQYGNGGAHLIVANMYGPQDHFNLETSHVVPALIRKISDAKENNNDFIHLWGTGTPTRELLFSADAAEAIVKAIILQIDEEAPINVGTGKDISIKDLARMIANIYEYDGEFVFDASKPDGQPKRRLDVSRAKNILGFEAKTSLEDGLKKTIAWYEENKCCLKD